MSRRTALLTVALAAAVPRLVVVAVERERLLSGLTEKSDRFARTFVDSGTFGFLPGVPSGLHAAALRVLPGPDLLGLRPLLGRRGADPGRRRGRDGAARLRDRRRRSPSARSASAAALLATLNPYLIWHDVHLNREVLDGLLAALLTLLVVLATQRRSLRIAGAAGVAVGLAILGNARLAAAPARPRRLSPLGRGAAPAGHLAGAALVVASAVAVLPWVSAMTSPLGAPR